MAKKANDTTAPPLPFSHPLRVATLSAAKPTGFDLRPDAATLAKIAGFLGIRGLQEMRFRGEIAGEEDDNWVVTGRLTAHTSQDCVVTLEPVLQRIDETVRRVYVPEDDADALDVDFDPDAEDEFDVFDDAIDIAALAIETIALSLDPYPRKSEARIETTTFSAPGIAPIQDEDLKPFAGLAALRDKLADK